MSEEQRERPQKWYGDLVEGKTNQSSETQPDESTIENTPTRFLPEKIHWGFLTIDNIHQFLEAGVKDLPPIEGGGQLHNSSETKNKEARILYLKTTLGINPAEIPDPTKPNEFLSERLVTDVLIDTIALCHTIQALLDITPAPNNVDTHISLNLAIYNAVNQVRSLKGELDLDIKMGDTSVSSRKFGQDHGYYPDRSTNATRAGQFTVIFDKLSASATARSNAMKQFQLGNQ